MTIYLPIAEMTVNLFLILGLGGLTGLLSGMFGIGGGFLMTPLLIFIGVPPSVAVASTTNQIVASSLSGFLVHWRRMNVDFQIGSLLLVGGLLGSTAGVWIFSYLKSLGQIDLVISLSYVGFLTFIGGLMSIESFRTIARAREAKRRGIPKTRIRTKSAQSLSADGKKSWLQRMPFNYHFSRSNIEMSLLIPPVLGFLVGVLVSILGIGGGFFMIPAMIYILKMPTQVVVGTSLFQVIFVTANVTILHATQNQTVDVILAMMLLTGSVISAQIGTRLATKLPTEYLRGLLALIVLGVAFKLALGLLATPDDIFSLTLENRS